MQMRLRTGDVATAEGAGNSRMRICAYVLAGGASRRMGSDKLTLARAPAAEETILEHVIGCVLQVADEVFVLTSPDGRLVSGRHSLDPIVRIVADHDRHQGPLRALEHAWGLSDAVYRFVIAGDLPGLSPHVLQACFDRLTVARELGESLPDGAVVVREGRLQPLLGCYRAEAGRAWRIAGETGEMRLMHAVGRLRLVAVDGDLQGWPAWWTRPVHTPADYDEWLERH